MSAAWHGFGQHGGDPSFIIHTQSAQEFLYNTAVALTKLSVLALYYRIFSQTRFLKIAILTVSLIVVAWWIAFTVAGFVLCTPIRPYWNPQIKLRCLYTWDFYVSQAVPNIVLDFLLLLLPLPPLWKLQMKRPRKTILMTVFVLGYL